MQGRAKPHKFQSWTSRLSAEIVININAFLELPEDSTYLEGSLTGQLFVSDESHFTLVSESMCQHPT